MNDTIMLSLPKDNLTNGKYRTESKTLQLCVIPNTEENRKAIRQINRLAKQQNSHFKLKQRYRCPKEGHHYGFGGDLAKEYANGIGIYIEGATVKSIVDSGREYWRNRMDQVFIENQMLKEQIRSLKKEIATKSAIEHLETTCGYYKNENGEDDVYRAMCDMVGSLTEDS